MHGSWAPRLHTPNDISIGSSVSAGLTMGVRAVWDAMTRNVVTGGSRTVHANPLQLK